MIVLVVLLAAALVGVLALLIARERDRRQPRLATASPTRIVFPFTGSALSQRGLDAALRLAHVDGATLMPVYLARVPLHLPLDAALPRQCDSALPLLEAVEQRAVRAGVAVDSRIERGRTYRHAIRELVAHERVDTLVIAAGDSDSAGLLPDDIGWLLAAVPGEIIVIRPGVPLSVDALRVRNGRREGGRRSRPGRRRPMGADRSR